MTRSEEIVYIARKFGFVREVGGPNKGLWVGMFQHLCDGNPGDSWCAYFVCSVLAIVYGGFSKSPLIKTGVCQVIYGQAKISGWLRDKPEQIGDLFLYVDEHNHAHHVGFVTNDDPTLMGIAGNTSEDGMSSNGVGIFEHAVHSKVFVHYPRGE